MMMADDNDNDDDDDASDDDDDDEEHDCGWRLMIMMIMVIMVVIMVVKVMTNEAITKSSIQSKDKVKSVGKLPTYFICCAREV